MLSYCQSDALKTNDSINKQRYTKKNYAVITGYQIQRNHFAEIGIGIMEDGITGRHPTTLIYELSNELKLIMISIWGLKAGLWIGGGAAGLNLGLNLINYTDFNKNALRFRPEVGMGFGVFRIV